MDRNVFGKSKRIIRLIIDKACDAIFLTGITEEDDSGVLLEVNQEAAEILDHAREDLPGTVLGEFDESKRDLILPCLPEKLAKEEVNQFERVHETSEGGKVPVELKSHLIELEGAKVVLTLAKDISERTKSLRGIKKNKERLEKAMEAGGLAWWSMELPSGKIDFHRRKATMLGYSPNQFDHYEDFTELIHPEEYEEAMESMKKHLRGEEKRYEIEYRLQKKGGGYKWFHDVGSISETDDDSDHQIITGIIIDVDDRKRAEKELIQEREKLRKLHEAVDKFQQCETEEDLCNSATEATQNILNFDFCTFYCYENNELAPIATTEEKGAKEIPPQEMNEGPAGKSFRMQKTLIGETEEGSFPVNPPDGDLKSYISVPIGDVGVFFAASTEEEGFGERESNLAEILAGHLNEEIKRIRLEEKLRSRAIRDPLTGLYNRRYFNETLEKEVERSERYEVPIGFLMIDVNRFKEINDRYSHQVGDKVLKEVADLLSSNVRDADSVVRYGGDEFLVMMPETNGGVSNTISRLRNNLEDWNETSDLLDFDLTLAMGVSHWSPGQERDVADAIKEADEEMYRDKTS